MDMLNNLQKPQTNNHAVTPSQINGFHHQVEVEIDSCHRDGSVDTQCIWITR